MKVIHLEFQTVLLGALITLLYMSQNSNADVTPGELQALTDIYNNMNGVNWNFQTNWTDGDPCSQGWEGVTCMENFVISLDISYNNVTGYFPSTFGDLQYLNTLFAGSNSLTGSLASIFNILPSSLTYL